MYDANLRPARLARVFGASALNAAGALIISGLACAPQLAHADVFTVTRTGDTPGPCTTTALLGCNLRQAIDAANATTEPDTIRFNIPACGARFINITGPTLHITHPVIIDGNTQPLCGDPIPGDRTSLIEIRGPGVNVRPNGTILHGLVLDAGSSRSQIRGLAINGFSGSGIGVNSSNNAIIDDKLGTDATGNLARPNNIGITIGNTVTGNAIGDSVISANQAMGIDVLGDSTQVFENLIGTKADGVTPLGNGGDGIATFGANNNQIGIAAAIGNTIAFNGGAGVRIGLGNFNEVLGNKIHDNAGLGVQLSGTGANHNQAAPTITVADRNFQVVGTPPLVRIQVVTTISGTLANVNGSGSFAVDLYGNDACDSANPAEGQIFIKSVAVNANGTFSWTTTGPTGAFITGIGRSPDGDTSQFSTCKAVTQ